MRAGKLRQDATLQTVTQTGDIHGGTVDVFGDDCQVWCSIEPLTGKEQLINQTKDARITHRIRLRWQDGISPKQRLLFRDRKFNFLTVRNVDERNSEYEIMAEEDV